MSAVAPTTTSTTPEGVQHGAKAHSDGGWGVVPVQTRSERFRSTDPAAFPAVTGREVDDPGMANLIARVGSGIRLG